MIHFFFRYNIFFKAVREEIHSSSNDRPSFSGLVQLVSQRWRETTPENKTKFEIQAKADYQRYADEMAQYRQRPEVQSVLVDPAANGSKRRCKFLGVSKRPLSGYNIFFREEHARLKVPLHLKLCSYFWYILCLLLTFFFLETQSRN